MKRTLIAIAFIAALTGCGNTGITGITPQTVAVDLSTADKAIAASNTIIATLPPSAGKTAMVAYLPTVTGYADAIAAFANVVSMLTTPTVATTQPAK